MMAETIIRQREAEELPNAQFADLLFSDFMRGPVAVIAALYPTMELEFRDEDAGRIHAYLAAKPQGKHGVHRYARGVRAGCGGVAGAICPVLRVLWSGGRVIGRGNCPGLAKKMNPDVSKPLSSVAPSCRVTLDQRGNDYVQY